MQFNLFQKGIISTYRIVMTSVLIVVMVGILSYLFLMLFYGVDRNWAAPLVLSPTQSKVLAFQPDVAALEASLLKNRVELNTAIRKYQAIEDQVTQLQSLSAQFARAQRFEAKALASVNASLQGVLRQKRMDIDQTRQAVDEARPMLASLDAELSAGLITKDEVARRRMDMRTAQNALTDSQVQTVLLATQASQASAASNTLTQSGAASLTALQSLTSDAQIRIAIAQASVDAGTAKEAIHQLEATVKEGERVLQTAKRSPYYRALTTSVPVVFVPYDNVSAAKVGAPVFDCMLQVLLCRKVGKVVEVYEAEEYARHPLFKTDIRGKFAEIDFEEREASESSVVFLSFKPLLL
ncbi:hypothetical protein [Ralstonia flatus]|uniref:Uncharacterized protein n=1 Tax=Ralstonia flatus TaxID=3058601 RepID=A0AAD2F7Y2_9RALS|nr:hypothetical protein [Ralstonia sp. LMG 32965]MBN6209211.1 hypothetical protein [Ralstonia pickettii]CAJ0858365.1 hypothetical protein R77567_01270 [Ralstonia sp. LMG 32965]CAJ0861508.1 hypothetical protein R77564_00832 [Ralstonia sp. LMG 32965]